MFVSDYFITNGNYFIVFILWLHSDDIFEKFKYILSQWYADFLGFIHRKLTRADLICSWNHYKTNFVSFWFGWASSKIWREKRKKKVGIRKYKMLILTIPPIINMPKRPAVLCYSLMNRKLFISLLSFWMCRSNWNLLFRK